MKRILFLTYLLLFAQVSCTFYPKNLETSSDNIIETDKQVTTQENQTTELVLSCFDGVPDYISSAIEIFNSENNGYNIILKDYSQFIGEMPEEGDEDFEGKIEKAYNEAYQKFFDDCINGTEIDIMYNDKQIKHFYKLLSSDIFVNLYDYSDNNFSELNSNIIKQSETDGQLFEMPLSFAINTLIGIEQYTKNNWSLDEFIECCNSLPNDIILCNPEHRSGVYDILVTYNMMSFFSDNGELSFNVDEYRKALDFCMNFDNNISDSDNKCFLQDTYVNNFNSFHNSIEKFEAHNGEAVMVGFPSDNGNNTVIDVQDTISICNKSLPEEQKGAFEFLKLLVSEEEQSKITNNFPINNNSFNQISEEQIEKELFTEEEKTELDNIIADGKIKKDYISDVNSLIGADETNVLLEFQSIDETIKQIQEKIYTFKGNLK